MKTIVCFIAAIALIAMAFLSGCSLIEKDFDGEVSVHYPVNETDDDSDITYDEIRTLNALDDEDIRDNLEKIQNWTVTKVSYSISGYQGDDDATFSGILGFSRNSDMSASISVPVSGLKLSDLNGKAKLDLGLSSSDLSKLASWFEADNALKVYMNGTLSQGPISFYLDVYAGIRIRARIL